MRARVAAAHVRHPEVLRSGQLSAWIRLSSNHHRDSTWWLLAQDCVRRSLPGAPAASVPRLSAHTSASAELLPGRARACCTWTTRATTGRRRARRHISSLPTSPARASQWASFGASELNAWLAAGDAAVSAAEQAPLAAATSTCCPVDAAAAARRRLSSVSFAGVDADPDTPLAALRGCSFDLAGPKARRRSAPPRGLR